MIVTEYRLPDNLERDMIRAAIHLCDTARSLSGADLIQLLPETGAAALGLQVNLQFYKNGDYQAASFQLSAAAEVQAVKTFHVYVSFSQGYETAKDDLLEGAHGYWLRSSATQLLERYGRIFGELKTEELEEMEKRRRYYSFRWNHGPMERNESLCAELARREIAARDQDSSHSRLVAIEAARRFARFRAEENASAMNWWHGLALADRKTLPKYPVRDLPEAQKALFTYRDYLANRHSPGERSGNVIVRQASGVMACT
jgi:hypothetical protein